MGVFGAGGHPIKLTVRQRKWIVLNILEGITGISRAVLRRKIKEIDIEDDREIADFIIKQIKDGVQGR